MSLFSYFMSGMAFLFYTAAVCLLTVALDSRDGTAEAVQVSAAMVSVSLGAVATTLAVEGDVTVKIFLPLSVFFVLAALICLAAGIRLARKAAGYTKRKRFCSARVFTRSAFAAGAGTLCMGTLAALCMVLA